MVFLREPNERRLWLMLAIVLGTSLLLLLMALQLPWFTATYSVAGSEFRGTFDFDEWRVQIFNNGVEGNSPPAQFYRDGSDFEVLMERMQLLLAVGLVAAAGLAAVLVAFYLGYLAEPQVLLRVAWGTSVTVIAGALAYFAFQVAEAGADQVFSTLVSLPQVDASALGRPEPKFWGTQGYANGELETAPGAGWLLALLAFVNLVLGTMLLYRFPAEAEVGSEDYALDDEPAMDESTVGPSEA